MKKGIIISFITTLLLLTVLFTYLTTGFRGYYYKADQTIGVYQLYQYKVTSLSGYCKGLETVDVFFDDDYRYQLYYYCDGRGSFIKYKGNFLRLDVALEKDLITIDDIINTNVIRKNEIEIFQFKAKVLKNDANGFIIQPNPNTTEINSSNEIIIHMNNTQILDGHGNEIPLNQIKMNDEVEIIYDGLIAESDPAQINRCFKIKKLTDESN